MLTTEMMMEDSLREWAQECLRMSATVEDITDVMDTVMKELLSLEDYLKAIDEAKFRP